MNLIIYIKIGIEQYAVLFWLILGIQCTTDLLDIHCPAGREWQIRAKAHCGLPGKYTCLFDSIKHMYMESCDGPKLEPPGEQTVINSNNFDTVQCTDKRYQPFSFTTTEGSDCLYKKTMCNEEGQFVYSNGSGTLDRRCRCDHTQGYAYVTPGNDQCSCNSTTQDCSCYLKKCMKGQILSPDYRCIDKNLNKGGKFHCREFPTDEHKNLSNRTEELCCKTEEKKKVHNVRWRDASAIVALVFIVLIVLSFFLTYICKEDELPSCDRQHYQEVSQDKEEKQTLANNKAFDVSCTDQEVFQIKEENQTLVNNKGKEVEEEKSVGNGRDKCKEMCVVVVGDGACGKTSLIEVFLTGIFTKNHIPTCFQTSSTSITVQGKQVDLKVRDTPGQESYDNMRELAYHDADVFVVCFAVDNQDSFANVNSVWNKELKTNYPGIPRILVRNKIDIIDKKKNIEKLQKEKKNWIKDKTANDLKDMLGMTDYVSCSAKTNTGVENVFIVAAKAATSTAI